MPAQSPLDVLADELGAAAGRIERELRQECARLKAENTAFRSGLAERLSAMEVMFFKAEQERERVYRERLEKFASEIPVMSDIVDQVMGQISPMMDEMRGTVEDMRGEMVDVQGMMANCEARVADCEAMMMDRQNSFESEVGKKIETRLSELKDGKDGEPGKDADIEPLQNLIAEREVEILQSFAGLERILIGRINEKLSTVKDGEPGPAGPPGKDGTMAIAREWTEGVHQAGIIVVCNGSTYQAIRETDDEPPASDWIPLAVRGDKGFGFTLRGTFKADETYSLNDVVVVDRGSFGALRDNPGPCPGEGWQLLAGAGGRGKEGPAGPRGEKGMDGKSLTISKIDAHPDSMAIRIVDGTGKAHEVDLEPIAQQILEAAR